jgi:PAS domain S-box-containing protein
MDEFMGKTAWDYLVPEDHEKGNAYYQNTLKEGITRNAELSFFRLDGTRFPSEMSSALVKDTSGKPVAIINVLRDITERKLAEQALRESEERFRSYFEQGMLGMAISDKDMRWTEVNNRFCEILGYAKEEVLQRRITDFVHPDDLEAFHQSYGQVVSGGADHYTVDRRYRRKDGRVVFLNVFVKVFFSADGAADHCLALFDDVTHRKQAEEALRQSRDKLQAIYDTMGEGLAIADCATGRLLRANPAICRMLGYSEEQLMSLSVSDIHPPECAPEVLAMLRAHREGQKLIVENSPMLKKDGTVFYANIGNAWISFQGRSCVIGIFRDNTERKRAEEALQREHRTLKHLLQSSDHERRTIAYDIHDGLAQQLAGAIMQFDVYESLHEKRPDDAAKAYDAATTLLKQGHGESRRLIAGIRHPVLDEAGVVEAVAHLINEQNRAKGPQIAFHSIVNFSRLVPLLENAIYRIIQEGMTNACKYSRSDRVRITLLQQKDRLRIEIRDWGIGFNPRETKEGSYGLTGIRERARLLGGKFRLKTAAGKGTQIVVELPLLERE